MIVSRRLSTAAAIVAPIVLTVGVLALIFRSHHAGPPHPKEWDPRVLDIVQFDEQHRGLLFKQPVFVDFLDAQAYSERSRTEESTLTDEDKKQFEAVDSEFRALGLSNKKVDLFEQQNNLRDTGTLAFYDPTTERVIVRGTEMTVDLQVTLVHEFVHVLQDQYFGLGDERQRDFKTSQESSSFRAVFEGDATRIEDEFVASLSEEQRAQYVAAHNAEVSAASSVLADVPVALQALFNAPYAYGPPFVRLLDAFDHQTAVDNAFKTPPTTDEQLLVPTKFLAHEPATDVKEPALPDGVSKDAVVDSGDFGAFSWLLVLAERIDPIVALEATDGWGGDAYVAFTQNDRTCVRLAWQADTSTDNQEMKDALDQWVAAMPPGAASVTADGDLLQVQSCDPGADQVTLNNRALDVLQLPSTRSLLALSVVQQGVTFDKAFDYGQCVVRGLGFEQIVAINKEGLNDETTATLQSVEAECADQAGG
jgi:hypothetical protein